MPDESVTELSKTCDMTKSRRSHSNALDVPSIRTENGYEIRSLCCLSLRLGKLISG